MRGSYKLLVTTHVDTSTGVITDVQGLAALSRKAGTLFIVDGVCSVAGEDLRMTEWGVDLALTASQKAIGVPPGLALLVAGPRALQAFKSRKSPVLNYYADWNNWLPIMEAYEARKAAYFATPAVNLVNALNVSLGQILAEGMQNALCAPSKDRAGLPGRPGSAGPGADPAQAGVCRPYLIRPALPAGSGWRKTAGSRQPPRSDPGWRAAPRLPD